MRFIILKFNDMWIEALFYICFSVICLWIVSLYKEKRRAGRKLYSRSEMLYLSSQCTTTPINWISIHEIKKKYHQPQSTKLKEEKFRVKSLTKGKHLVLPIEDIENSPIFENLHTTEFISSIPKSSSNYSSSFEEKVKSAVHSGNLYHAAFILNEMDTQGIEVKRNLLDSFLSLYNTKRISFSPMNPNVQDFVPRFSKLNPNIQEFRPYELNPDALDFTPSRNDI